MLLAPIPAGRRLCRKKRAIDAGAAVQTSAVLRLHSNIIGEIYTCGAETALPWRKCGSRHALGYPRGRRSLDFRLTPSNLRCRRQRSDALTFAWRSLTRQE